jgi:hypothetical protein
MKTELALTFFPSPSDCSLFALLVALPTEITSKKQQLLYKRDLSLLDASGCVVKLTIWVSGGAAQLAGQCGSRAVWFPNRADRC